MTTTIAAPTPPRSTGYTLPNARRVSFEERILLNPRPATLTVEILIERALYQKGTIARIYHRYFGIEKSSLDPSLTSLRNARTITRKQTGKSHRDLSGRAYSVDTVGIAIDVAARMVEVNAHAKYNPTFASVDSYIVGFARMWFRKQVEVKGRHDRILREGVAVQPTRTVGTFADAAIEQEQASESMATIRSRLTPMEGRLLDLLVRSGKFDADQAAAALDTDPTHARTLMAGVRKAARFVGFQDGAPRALGNRVA